MTSPDRPSYLTIPSLAGLALSLLLVGAVSTVSAGVTLPQIPGWYAALSKPSWTPPNWVFGPVWTSLYVMMAVAAWLVWRGGGKAAHGALSLYGVQLALNLLWSLLFFGSGLLTAAAAEIVVLLAAIAATAWSFRRFSRAAPLLLVPYLLWVSYATALTIAVATRNPG